jgi:RNA polymerase sigma-70 factor (ECF subfamily)
MDEAKLIRYAQQGDLNSFNRLVLKYQDMVYNQAYRVMGETFSAEDATQNSFVSAFRKIRSFRGGSFKSWLLRIVTNECYDELRRRKRKPAIPLEPDYHNGKEVESPHWVVDPSESPEDYALRDELSGAIQNCLNKLPFEFRIVIVLVDIQGFHYSEAADTLRKPVGTIKSRLARARLGMRECLMGFWELLPSSFRLENEKAQ